MIHEWGGTFVRGAMHLDEQSLDFVEISLEGVEISARLEMFRGRAAIPT